MKISDIYKAGEFEQLLAGAEAFATGQWQENFISDMRERFDKYGDSMFLSDKQKVRIEEIASGTNKKPTEGAP